MYVLSEIKYDVSEYYINVKKKFEDILILFEIFVLWWVWGGFSWDVLRGVVLFVK